MERCVAATLRVHTLAKELGVPSKAIIEKCHAEGIELKNHMAAISLGLAESIREWFSVGDDITSVEVAERVDVEVVRKARRKARTAEIAPGEAAVKVAPESGPVGEALTETIEKPAEVSLEPALPPAAEGMAAAALPVEVTVPRVLEAVPPAAPQVAGLEEAPAPAVAGAEALAARAPGAPESAPPAVGREVAESAAAPEVEPMAPELAPRVTEPLLPAEPIKPAGPQVVPAPAELRGPTVVRIEAPEPHVVPRPRTGLGRGVGDRAPAATAGTVTAPPPRRGRAKGRKTEEEEAAAFRARSPRRHGATSDIDQRLREWRDQDLLERKERLASVTGHGLRDRRAAERRRQASAQTGALQPARRDSIPITTPVSIKDFSAAVGVPFVTLSKILFEHTERLWTINQTLDAEQAELLALDLGVPIQVERARTAYEALEEEFTQREPEHLEPRPPVVAMLGHVDHGKTSLLDAIRRAHVAAGEAGGITQHIGAYRLDRGDWHVTFVDTPGHEAFTAMRARGANLTDVVVLVVAADDGVMPQTVEAINHAKAAGVPIVVALNKIDLPGIDLNRVYSGLAEHGLAPAEWGGETDLIKTSATTGQGIDELVAHLSTLSELLELKADPTVPAHAIVIEAQMREGRGIVAQVLVREGTLRPGQCVVCGPGAGRIRALRDDQGRRVKEAGPGTPVEVSGLDELPSAGDRLYQVESLSQAKQFGDEVRQRRREESLVAAPKSRTLEALLLGQAEATVPELNVILKADVQGSVEVLRKSLGDFPAEKARLNILHAGVGAASEADVHLAKASGAIIIGFHVVAEERARQLADQLGVEIRQYLVIYELLDDLHKALAGLLAPLEREEIRGSAEVRQIFNITRVGVIAGCYVTDGIINRAHRVRLVRDARIVVEGKPIGSLRRFKDDAREVRAGFECGIKIQDFDDVKPGDVIQAYEVVEVMQDL
jgi:translation initiation factor IF-2